MSRTKSAGITIEADVSCRLIFIRDSFFIPPSVGQVISVALSLLDASTDITTKEKTVLIPFS